LAVEPRALQPTCPPLRRPERLFDPATTVHGLRAAQVEVAGPDRLVRVWLYRDPPAALADPGLWRLTPSPGGAPVGVAAAAIEASPAPHVLLDLAGRPDPARYRLDVAPPAGVVFDPLRTWLAVRLLPECPDLGSCFAGPDERPAAAPSPVHDYLARDWRSLRAALLEYLVGRDPEADLSPADPGVTLLELFAHLGDLLHYRLDRVATEAYLETARRRTSVRRHARLVDFTLLEAASARAEVLVVLPPEAGPVTVRAGQVAADEPGSPVAFTLEDDLVARAELGEIPVYDFGEEACCLPEGATECVLVRPLPADPLGASWIRPGDLLAFEVVGAGDPDEHRRWSTRQQAWPVETPEARLRDPLASRAAQVVELTGVEPFEDPLLGASLALALVRWRAEDALLRDYPVGIDAGAGAPEVTVARANLVRAHHGRVADGPGTLAPLPRVGEDPATAAIGAWSATSAGAPARPGRPGGPGLALRDDGVPHRLEVAVTLPSGLVAGARHVAALLDPEASAADLPFVVDVEEDEPPVLAFRTGALGLAPPLGSVVAARYEVGGGAAGNVPANALTALERNTSPEGAAPAWSPVGAAVRNPAPASGGRDRMPLDVARRDAPEAFAVEPRRAVLPSDHAAAAAEDPLVQRAVARRVWSGSWPLVTTVVDLTVSGEAADQARAGLLATLDGLRMIGTEAAVVEGAPVGLLIALEVCVLPGVDGERARLDVLAALRPGTEERPGLFHPSRLVLGSAVYLSSVVAAAAAVPGVDAVEAVEARRLSDPQGTLLQVITVAPEEVAVLDDDPARPERGRLDVTVRGGG
jgi:hypothetical protein